MKPQVRRKDWGSTRLVHELALTVEQGGRPCKNLTGDLMSKINSEATKLIEEVQRDITDIIKNGMTGKRRTLMALKDEKVSTYILGIHFPRISGVWCRGDGSRYRETCYIKLGGRHILQQRKYSTYKTHFPTEESVYDFIWEKLKARRGAKEIGELSTEFGDQYSPAIKSAGVLWVKRPWGIEYSTPNRLNNTAVWRLRNTV